MYKYKTTDDDEFIVSDLRYRHYINLIIDKTIICTHRNI